MRRDFGNDRWYENRKQKDYIIGDPKSIVDGEKEKEKFNIRNIMSDRMIPGNEEYNRIKDPWMYFKGEPKPSDPDNDEYIPPL